MTKTIDWFKYWSKKKKQKLILESFIVYIKVDDTYKDIAEDIETRFETRLQIMN